MRPYAAFCCRLCVSDKTVVVTRPLSISRITKGTFSMDTRHLNLTGAALALSFIATAVYASSPVPMKPLRWRKPLCSGRSSPAHLRRRRSSLLPHATSSHAPRRRMRSITRSPRLTWRTKPGWTRKWRRLWLRKSAQRRRRLNLTPACRRCDRNQTAIRQPINKDIHEY